MASIQKDFLAFGGLIAQPQRGGEVCGRLARSPQGSIMDTSEKHLPQNRCKKGERIQEVTEHRGRTWWEDKSWIITIRQPRYLSALYHLAREQRQQRQLRGLLVLRIKFLADGRQSCLLAIVLDDRCDGLGMFDNL